MSFKSTPFPSSYIVIVEIFLLLEDIVEGNYSNLTFKFINEFLLFIFCKIQEEQEDIIFESL